MSALSPRAVWTALASGGTTGITTDDLIVRLDGPARRRIDRLELTLLLAVAASTGLLSPKGRPARWILTDDGAAYAAHLYTRPLVDAEVWSALADLDTTGAPDRFPGPGLAGRVGCPVRTMALWCRRQVLAGSLTRSPDGWELTEQGRRLVAAVAGVPA
ncbi:MULTISPECIES: hypothetical protein [Protofrankia]|uniref:Uncharacterized protein n=1 Tax=Protofrankia coriariae TaxID=1562887 RepID=A0ABR5F4H8_9ACTN|nr:MULTISPECIES: hypothetical protein [Protofrankia]KLL11553.1 hypothetical protein FrCorBMG51_10965 [Protofrankia coriariae]ONH35686.1 hypothetical protein BL254_10360 [Protofrankia sp. BMG5.30]